MRSKYSDTTLEYNGSQLRSHFLRENFALSGDAIVAFCGPCSVSSHMVDLEDVEKKEFIFSESMLHFIVEHFDGSLETAILRKRLLVAAIGDAVNTKRDKIVLRRSGNGLYCEKKKFNVAVATLSPVSSLIHVGVNISSKNTPIPTISLNDLRMDVKGFAAIIMKVYCDEIASAARSRTKVKAVK